MKKFLAKAKAWLNSPNGRRYETIIISVLIAEAVKRGYLPSSFLPKA